MVGLKTLKDFAEKADSYDESVGYSQCIRELRAEAIKWVKAMKANEPASFFNRKDISDDSLMISKMTTMEACSLFCRFFNITEEELK